MSARTLPSMSCALPARRTSQNEAMSLIHCGPNQSNVNFLRTLPSAFLVNQSGIRCEKRARSASASNASKLLPLSKAKSLARPSSKRNGAILAPTHTGRALCSCCVLMARGLLSACGHALPGAGGELRGGGSNACGQLNERKCCGALWGATIFFGSGLRFGASSDPCCRHCGCDRTLIGSCKQRPSDALRRAAR
jgi:hypothetical protein